jgi:pilus assembly protein CpaF
VSIFRNRSSQPNEQPQPEKSGKSSSLFGQNNGVSITPTVPMGYGVKQQATNGTANGVTNGDQQPIRTQDTTNSPATGQTYPGTQANVTPTVSKSPQDDITGVISVLSSYTPPPEFKKVREDVQQFLLNEVKTASEMSIAQVKQTIEPIFTQALTDANLVVSRVERIRMLDMIVADILGYGPIQPLLDHEDITEVMVNGSTQVYIEQRGKLYLTGIKFMDDNHVMQVIERIVTPLGRRIDESSPMVDARLPDGSRVNAIIPPLSLIGPCLTIRKFRKTPFTVEDLVKFGSMTPEFVQFLQACVIAKFNIVVSGGTGSGKTTLLNVLSSFIPHDERIVTIEDAAELQLQQPHVVRLEKRAANIEGKGEIGIRELVVNSLRMRPDRIVVGEVRRGEALDMLQAMNTGHNGSLTTVHSNSPRDTLNRIETMVLMSGVDLPLRAIRQQVASAVDLIVHIERMRDGKRRIVQCAEIIGMEGETIVMQDLFTFVQSGIDPDGRIMGGLQPTGLRPRQTDKFEVAGIVLPPNMFGLSGSNFWRDN